MITYTFTSSFQKFSNFKLHGLIYISTSSGLPSAGLDVFGDLKMVQKQPLAHKGLDERFSASIFNKTTIFPEAFNFKKIIRQYNEQNGTQNNTYNSWTVE